MVFEYDSTLSLEFEESSSVKKNGYCIKDISYLSPYGGRVHAYLVIPDTDGPFPAIVFMHHGNGSRKTFLVEAESLASQGVISLLIDSPFVNNRVPEDLSEEQKLSFIVETVTDIRKYTQTIVDIQRGIDLLSSFEFVDLNRIAYVGHSFGATWGGVLAGIEKRIKTYVLMAGFSSVSEWHRTSEHPSAIFIRSHLSRERFEHFVSKLESVDAVHYIKNVSPSTTVLFQFVYDDEFVSKFQAETFYSVTVSPKEILWYRTDHLFTDCDKAYQDRRKWIMKEFFNEY